MPAMSRSIFIARHGERIDFQDRRWYDRADYPYDPHLSAGGFRQARDLAQRLRHENLSAIFSSPFLRAVQTADAVAQATGLPIYLEEGCSEQLDGKWFPTGDPRVHSPAKLAQCYARIDVRYRAVVRPRWPEVWEQTVPRGQATARALAARYPGNLLLVGHGASVSALAWGLVTDYPQFTGHCCSLVQLVEDDAGRWRVALAGDVSHLSYMEPKLRFH